MRILAIDTTSNCLDWLIRCQLAGHECKWYDRTNDSGEPRRAGEGIITKIQNYQEIQRKWLDWADLIYLPDNTRYIDMLEPYRIRGYPIFGPGVEAAHLELDRQAGQDSMKKAGLNIIPGKTFHDYKDAIRYVEKEGTPFVSKPSGDADKALSYVGHDAADLIFMLERWNKNPQYRKMAKKDGFILQEKIEGCEMAVGGYFGPSGFCGPWIENFENKKLCNGDLGPNTGEMGTLVRPVRKSKLADLVLKPFAKQLKAMDYVGYVDCAVIIDKAGEPWPLEWTMRDGWPIRHNITSLFMGDPAKWMLDLINGMDSIDSKDGTISVSVVMPLPPFPYQHVVGKDLDGIPIYHGTDLEHVHLSEARLERDVPMMIAGKIVRLPCYVATDVYPCVITGTGETISGARKSAYAAVKKVKIPNSPFYRTDIGAGRMVKQLPILQKFGYATGMEM